MPMLLTLTQEFAVSTVQKTWVMAINAIMGGKWIHAVSKSVQKDLVKFAAENTSATEFAEKV